MSLIKVPKLEHDVNYYQNINQKILVDNIIKFRGDLRDELVTC